MDLIDKNALNFLWITEFPLFEYDDEEKIYHSVHHPFTSPNRDGLENLIHFLLKIVNQ